MRRGYGTYVAADGVLDVARDVLEVLRRRLFGQRCAVLQQRSLAWTVLEARRQPLAIQQLRAQLPQLFSFICRRANIRRGQTRVSCVTCRMSVGGMGDDSVCSDREVVAVGVGVGRNGAIYCTLRQQRSKTDSEAAKQALSARSMPSKVRARRCDGSGAAGEF